MIAGSAKGSWPPAIPFPVTPFIEDEFPHTLGWLTLGNPATRSIEVWSGVARLSPIRTTTTNEFSCRPFIGTAIVTETVQIDHSAYMCTISRCQTAMAKRPMVSGT